ncbi:MAG TPA: acyl-CoA thioesterase [Planctomycetota bacterium]|nr:acyl-CoA thioesterase [Planctomycetota bacterium]
MISESTLLVRPEHLNHHGFLFGGRLLEWLDEQAYISAISHLKPEANLVTVAIDRVEFRFSVVQGSLLRFRSLPVHVGKTSLTVFTQVFRLRTSTAGQASSGTKEAWGDEIFRAYVSFVCLDKNAQPRKVAPLLLQPLSRERLVKEERHHWDEVERARAQRSLTRKK